MGIRCKGFHEPGNGFRSLGHSCSYGCQNRGQSITTRMMVNRLAVGHSSPCKVRWSHETSQLLDTRGRSRISNRVQIDKTRRAVNVFGAYFKKS